MRARRELPDLPEGALRDHGTEERVDRIWQRLEGDLAVSRPRRNVMFWAPAAAAIVFGLGVFVGARWFAVTTPLPTTVAAEPPSEPNEVLPSQGPVPSPEEQQETYPSVPLKRAPIPVIGVAGAPAILGEPVTPPPTTLLVPTTPTWQVHADNGDYEPAWTALEAQGGFDSVLGKASADQLMLLYEMAVFKKQSGRAMQALRAVVDYVPNDSNAHMAAYQLGAALQKAGDNAGADKYFAIARALNPKGDFAEDALARQIQAAAAQGNVELTKKLSEQYEKDFPNGRRIGEVRDRLRKLKGNAAVKTPAAPLPEEGPVDDEEEAPIPAPPKPSAKPAP
jgi:TolA-binding protein